MNHEVISEPLEEKPSLTSLNQLHEELSAIEGLYYIGGIWETDLHEFDGEVEVCNLLVGAEGKISSLSLWGEFTKEVAQSLPAKPVQIELPSTDTDRRFYEPGKILFREWIGVKEESVSLFQEVDSTALNKAPWMKAHPIENSYSKSDCIFRDLIVEVWPDDLTAEAAFMYRSDDFDKMDDMVRKSFSKNMNYGDRLSSRFFDRIKKGFDPFDPPPSLLKSIVTFGAADYRHPLRQK